MKKGVETGYVQEFDNSGNPNPLTFGIFQLNQEYIVALSLVDATVALHNGDPRAARTASIRDLDSLLSTALVDPAVAARVRTSVQDSLHNVVDYSGLTRRLLEPINEQAAGSRVARNLSTTYEVTDTEGKPLRSIVVPDIILSVDRPVVLTPNTMMVAMQ